MAKKYFSDLNYSLGNEDTNLEVQMTQKLQSKNIFSIAGCGSRSIPLLACRPDNLVIADVSSQQIALSKLRLETTKHLSHQDFLLFWGFPPYYAYDYSKARKELFHHLNLDREVREYFFGLFSRHNWNSILHLGKWEKTFNTLSKGLRLIMGKDYDRILHFTNLDEQIDYYENDFPMLKWKSVIFLLGNKNVFNALLYKGDFIEKNVNESFFEYYFSSFDKLIRNNLARDSFFMHLCFKGHLFHSDGNTIEAKKENFEKTKEALIHNEATNVIFDKKDMISSITEKGEDYFDFLSLSDVPSYFGGDLEKNFISQIKPCVKKNGIIVLRNYLRIPDADTSGFEEVTGEYQDLINKEKVQMYRIQVFKKK